MDSARLRILLVEDNPVEANLAQKRLASSTEQFEVTHVETMAAALDRLQTTSFDAALLDLSLPDSGGIEVLERIAATDPHLPIVILTGLDDEALAAEALRKGAQDYLVKGKFGGDMIIRAIRYARERKRAEDALRQSHDQLQTIFDGAIEGILVADIETQQFLASNAAIRRMLGYSESDLLSLSVRDIHPAHESSNVLQKFSDMAQGRLSVVEEIPVLRKDGSMFFANISASTIIYNGRLSVVGFFHDITERKRVEEELRHEQEFARALLENMVDGVIACDENFRLTLFNRTAREWHGLDALAMPPEQWADFYDLFCTDGVTRMSIDNVPLARAFRGEALHDEGLEIRAKGQPPRHILSNCVPFYDDKGRKLGAVAVMRDITDRKRAEGELRKYRDHLEELVQQRTAELVLARDQAQAAEAQAEAANRAKSVFLASMSHELRTPLNAVLGFSQFMRTDSTLNESQKEDLDIINRSGTHLLGLINDVLEMSRIESGRLGREETNFDLWSTLDILKDMVRSRASAKGLRFILERDPTLPRYIKADERKLKQVIINLVGNAIKFTHHGEIILRARAENGGGLLRFEVEDTGPGIDAQAIQTMFEPFAQGSHNQEGAGLGLFISQKLVEFMGGQLAVQSELDKGSIFSFDIRCESVAATEIASRSVHRCAVSLAPGQTPPRVLVAEDTPESRLLMTKTLRSTGFEVIEAENGLEAVQLFEGQQPDLVLMDMRMPVMDGYEAIRRIRASGRGQTTPIIAVTASAFEEDRQKILALGADNFVSKPMQAAELFEKIRLLLGIAYIYADERAEGGEAQDQMGLRAIVAQLPEDLIHELAHAMTVLDLDGFRALLPRVAEHNPHLAERLRALANNCRMTELTELLPTAFIR